MSNSFRRALRSLTGDDSRGARWRWLLALGVLAAWSIWFLLARVELYAVTDDARLEVTALIHPVESAIAGRVSVSHLTLSRSVQAQEILVELDARSEQLSLDEEKTRSSAALKEIEVLRKQEEVEKQALTQEQEADRASLDVARARHRESQATAQLAKDRLTRLEKLQTQQAVAEMELVEARGEAAKSQAASEALGLTVSQLELEQRMRQSDRHSLLEKLRSDIARLEGRVATSAATVARLEYEIERHRIRAPVSGRLGEIADLRVGSVVQSGDKLASVVPAGELQIVANYAPAEALGRIQPGQPGRLRLHGFPWMQYGSIRATVTRTGSEVRNGRVRVELVAHLDPHSLIPREHALPGTLEVQYDRVSPAVLILRAAGRLLTGSESSAQAAAPE